MSARSTCLALARVTASGLTTLYTVPAGKVTLVKGYTVFNDDSVAHNFLLVVTRGGNDYYVHRQYLNANGTGGDSEWPGVWWVLQANDVLKMYKNAAGGGINILLGGAELDA